MALTILGLSGALMVGVGAAKALALSDAVDAGILQRESVESHGVALTVYRRCPQAIAGMTSEQAVSILSRRRRKPPAETTRPVLGSSDLPLDPGRASCPAPVHGDDEAVPREAARPAHVRASDVDSLVQGSLERWVTAGYRAKHPARVDQLARMIKSTTPAGYAGCCDVLAETNLLPELSKIACPVRVIAGLHDPSTPPSRAEEIVSAIRGAEVVTLEAAHISAVEVPDAFAATVRGFLSSIERTNKA